MIGRERQCQANRAEGRQVGGGVARGGGIIVGEHHRSPPDKEVSEKEGAAADYAAGRPLTDNPALTGPTVRATTHRLAVLP